MTRPMFWVVLGLLVTLGALSVEAEELRGRVVAVADGDTVTVRDAGRREHRVRLTGIDAPEKAQAFGRASKERLADAVHGREVVVEYHKTDRYGRLVGVVYLDGVDQDLAQVRGGLAWHYKAYEGEQSPADRWAYAAG